MPVIAETLIYVMVMWMAGVPSSLIYIFEAIYVNTY